MGVPIEITVVYSEVVNLAMQQNHVPVIKKLQIKNLTENELNDLTVIINCDPKFADEWSFSLAAVQPDKTVELTPVDIRLSPAFLYDVTERAEGLLKISVFDKDGLELCENAYNIGVTACNEWSGANVIPEIIAAFVTPNHPYIVDIIRRAGQLLQKWEGDPSFTGYQRQNPNAVLKQMAAIYGSLQQENIAYCMPPASFETIGQRVRLCSEIKEKRMGTCIDLSLLYAGCLEYVGLNSIIVLIEGHAFVGCWLEDECFAECVQDDASMLTKRMASGINQITLVECTDYVSGKEASFEDAVRDGKQHLLDGEKLIYFVDVKRCRGSRIRPLPLRVKNEDGTESFVSTEKEVKAKITDAPKELEVGEELEYADNIECTKQQVWERKLLDLSLKNTLLNFRVTKNNIQLLVSSISRLEDALSGGEEFTIMHRPSDLNGAMRDNKIFELDNSESIVDALMETEFQNHRIRTLLDENALAAAIKNLYRTAKCNMEENGANTLYLAMGFLRWYETDVSEKPRYAPLILMPIDIVRKSAQKGYVIRVRDEETQFNVTLLEWLRTEYGLNISGLDPLPLDQSGTDINAVFRIVRQAVMNKSRWDVEEFSFIGIFSFSQFIMWNDIRNRVDDLRNNKIVASLMSGKLEWTPEESFPEINTLDDAIAPLDIAVPVSADSSQLAAICAAGQGASFVLHGPPGTGKSQTITNMIANALYQGKSVLFIAEKMAALSVVQRRLQNIGLAPFCLELHSNKAKKKEVLNQLEATLEIGRIKNPENYEQQAEKLYALRKELNALMQLLHERKAYGFSLYDAVCRAEQYAEYPDCIKFSDHHVRTLTKEIFAEWEDICDEVAAADKGCGNVFGHPLREIANSEYTQSLKSEIESEAAEIIKISEDLKKSASEFASQFGVENASTHRQIASLKMLCDILSSAKNVPVNMLTRPDLQEIDLKLNEICAAGLKRDEIEAVLFKDFEKQIAGLDASSMLREWKEAETRWIIPRMQAQGKIVKSLKSLSLNPKGFDNSKVENILRQIIEYKEQNEIVQVESALFTELYGAAWNGGRCNWHELRNMYNIVVDIREVSSSICKTIPEQLEMLENIKAQLSSGIENYRSMSGRILASFASAYNSFNEHLNVLSIKMKFEFINVDDDNWLDAVKGICTRISENIERLRDWCGYLQKREKAVNAELKNVVDAIEKGDISGESILPAFYRNIYCKCAAFEIDADERLSSFTGMLFEQKINKFKELSNEYEKLTRQELIAGLSANIPVNANGASGSSEIGILQRAIRSGGRGMSIRKLFDSIPNLLRSLCPCMLMSPISVAQYIDPKYPKFDLVIFDEASQLPTYEAVGAIARGENLVVAGDPKQLPPTSFFTSNHVDEDNFEKEDLESVLEDCLALSMPQEHLLWHYRSRHESLIAFSNHEYYDNKLYTFPSPNDMVSEVKYIPVEGEYDRGATKQNRAEAKAVVDEIVRRLNDPKLCKQSMGVVTFSSVQQNLIEDMLEEEFSKHPELDEKNSASFEPLFVKNLENVQGDERDVIMFSIGYGPDKDGKVALNFGPLNRDGGWRRLNVAVTRARRQMLVFAVLRPEHIDLNKTRSTGLAGLKAFLEFAMRGKSALVDRPIDEHKSYTIADAVAERLNAEGIKVNTNIGCSEYRIDLGILNPNNPDEYILGILCDGETYSSSGTARDRNILQESVLKSLGWNTHRVWSLDWWENPEKEVEKIRAKLDDILCALSTEQAQEEAIADVNTDADEVNEKTEKIEESEEERPDIVDIGKFERIEVEKKAKSEKIYTLCELAPIKAEDVGNSEKFAAPESYKIIKKQIESVLQIEAPISRSLLCKRVLDVWGISRMGARIERTFDGILSDISMNVTEGGKQKFCWSLEQNPDEYDEYRVPLADGSFRRNMEDIPPQEIAAAVAQIVKNQFGISSDSLMKEVAAVFGFSRCTSAMQSYINEGISIAADKKWIAVDGDKVNIVM